METLQVDKNRYKEKGCSRQASLKEEVQTHCLPRPQFHKVLDDLVVSNNRMLIQVEGSEDSTFLQELRLIHRKTQKARPMYS